MRGYSFTSYTLLDTESSNNTLKYIWEVLVALQKPIIWEMYSWLYLVDSQNPCHRLDWTRLFTGKISFPIACLGYLLAICFGQQHFMKARLASFKIASLWKLFLKTWLNFARILRFFEPWTMACFKPEWFLGAVTSSHWGNEFCR